MSTATQAKHTPGPWIECHDLDGDYTIFADSKIIAITDLDRDDDKANARLIAVAPEMLDSLQELHDEFKLGGVCLRGECQHETCTRTYEIFDRAGEVLRKARGE